MGPNYIHCKFCDRVLNCHFFERHCFGCMDIVCEDCEKGHEFKYSELKNLIDHIIDHHNKKKNCDCKKQKWWNPIIKRYDRMTYIIDVNDIKNSIISIMECRVKPTIHL